MITQGRQTIGWLSIGGKRIDFLSRGRYNISPSPYSGAATAALKAQFSAEQWATIRDYGFAHPALVPFINEDPMMVMSLIEGLGTRWLHSTAEGIIKTTLKPASGIKYGANILVEQVDGRMAVFGSRTSGPTNSFLLHIYGTGWSTQSFSGGSWVEYGNVALNMNYKVEFSYKGIWVNDSQIVSGDYIPSSEMSDIWLGFNNVNGSPSATGFKGKYYDFYRLDGNGNKTNWLVPFIRNGQAEMLDVVTGQIQTRTGSFTISETPAS